MQALLRYLRQGRDRIAEYSDSEVSAASITVGSAADRHIQLLGHDVAPKHAAIRPAGDSFAISARRGARVLVNAAPVRTARLTVGDKVEIAGHQLTVIEAPAGFDLALTIQPNEKTAKSEFEGAFKTDLDQTLLSKRRTAWNLFLLISVLTLLVPLATAVVHRTGATTPAWIPDDTFWTAGPLIPAHAQAVGRRCEACHLSFFAPARDRECRQCHTKTADHVSVADLKLTRLGPAARCGVCHEEHNAPDGTLVVRDDSLCVTCHDAAHDKFGTLQVEKVSGFARSIHPLFKASLLTPPPRGSAIVAPLKVTPTGEPLAAAVNWPAVRTPLRTGQEQSHLSFSHKEHLDGNLVQRLSDSAPLGCEDCHTVAADGEHFIPITMARSCSGCHVLAFDDEAPERQLPHGKPREAMLMIEDYYVAKYSNPGRVTAPVAPRQRIPDRPVTTVACPSGTPLTRGRCQANAEIVDQFTRRGCASCHLVSDQGSGDVHERFDVLPVRLGRDYFPDLHFSHRQHAVQKQLTRDAACLSCHKARDSIRSSDLMLPELDKCLECHSDHAARDRVQVRCVSCHAYHFER